MKAGARLIEPIAKSAASSERGWIGGRRASSSEA